MSFTGSDFMPKQKEEVPLFWLFLWLSPISSDAWRKLPFPIWGKCVRGGSKISLDFQLFCNQRFQYCLRKNNTVS